MVRLGFGLSGSGSYATIECLRLGVIHILRMPQIIADFTSSGAALAQPADLDVDASYWLFIRNSYSGLAALRGIDLWVSKIPSMQRANR